MGTNKQKKRKIYRFSIKLYSDKKLDAVGIELLKNQTTMTTTGMFSLALATFARLYGVGDVSDYLLDVKEFKSSTNSKITSNISSLIENTQKRIQLQNSTNVKKREKEHNGQSKINQSLSPNTSSSKINKNSDKAFWDVWGNDDSDAKNRLETLKEKNKSSY